MSDQQAKTVLLIAPFQLEAFYRAVPFFIDFKEYYSETKAEVIVHPELLALGKVFFPGLKIHTPQAQDLSNPFRLHKFCYNLLDVFNVDDCYCLDNSWKGIFMSFVFGSSRRIGFIKSWKRFALTDGIKVEEEPLQGDYVGLLTVGTGQVFSIKGLPPVNADEVESIGDQHVFIDFNLGLINSRMDLFKWVEFLNFFENQTFVMNIFGESSSLEVLAEELNSESRWILKDKLDEEEKIRLIQSSKGVISNNLATAFLSTYLNRKI